MSTTNWTIHLDTCNSLPGIADRHLERARSLLRELAKHCESHGFEIAFDAQRAELKAKQGTFSTTVTMTEEVETREVYSGQDEVKAKVYDWQRVRQEMRPTPTGRLVLELSSDAGFGGRRRRWADRSRWSLEQKLGEIVTELDARAEIVAIRAVEADELQQLRQAEWSIAMRAARDDFVSDVRATVLADQVRRWSEAASIRAYCDDLEGALNDRQDPAEVAALRDWISWARTRADALNSLNQPPGMVEVEPTPEDLRRYLDGWSPYGPEERR